MSSDHLAEVWGDIVDTRHLRAAIAIGAVLSLSAYFGAVAGFRALGTDPSVSKTYAMLIGLAGCLVSCAICARLFPPKRVLIESGADASARQDAIAAILTSPEDRNQPLPAAAIEELRALGLDELIPGHTADGGPSSTIPTPSRASKRAVRHA